MLNHKFCSRAVKLLLAVAESPTCYRLLSVTNNSRKRPTALQSTLQYSPPHSHSIVPGGFEVTS